MSLKVRVTRPRGRKEIVKDTAEPFIDTADKIAEGKYAVATVAVGAGVLSLLGKGFKLFQKAVDYLGKKWPRKPRRKKTDSDKSESDNNSNQSKTEGEGSGGGQVSQKSMKAPPISSQKQAGHVKGTPQYKNRIKSGKPTSAFDDSQTADRLTEEAWKKGTPVEGRPNVREYEFGYRTGDGPNGGTQTKVRVHMDEQDRIHGHPSGPEY